MNKKNESPRTYNAEATRKRLLDAAEAMFADRGYNAVSMRDIARHANVNLAAAGYHFGSKENLFIESIMRQMRPLNEQRLAALDVLEARTSPPTLAEVLDVFVRVMVTTAVAERMTGCHLHRNLSRAFAESDEIARIVFRKEILPSATRFLHAIVRTCPTLTMPAAMHGLAMYAGCLIHTLRWAVNPPFPEMLQGFSPDADTIVSTLVAFGEAGFRKLAKQKLSAQKWNTTL